jgi:hypothetical protein
LPYLAVGPVLKGENYWEILPELTERSSAVEFVVWGRGGGKMSIAGLYTEWPISLSL